MALPGETPRLPPSVMAPVLVTVSAPSAEKVARFEPGRIVGQIQVVNWSFRSSSMVMPHLLGKVW